MSSSTNTRLNDYQSESMKGCKDQDRAMADLVVLVRLSIRGTFDIGFSSHSFTICCTQMYITRRGNIIPIGFPPRDPCLLIYPVCNLLMIVFALSVDCMTR